MAPSSPKSPSRRQDHGRDATEQTPLLGGSQLVSDGDTEASATPHDDNDPETSTLADHDRRKDASPGKPLPKMQISLLCFARMTEPIAFFSIFPFIAQMVQRNGHLPESDVGFYSGLIESLFSAVQMLVLIFWGRLSDRVGRKPVLLYCLAGMAVSPVLFGMATSIWQMILFRCLAGVFSGSGLIIRTMIGEHSTPDTQARAFSWFAFGGNVGIFIGPVVGGALADPATQYPSVFKGIRFFEQYPYSLPGFAIGGISLVGLVVSAFFLEETLPKQGTHPDGSGESQESSGRISMRELVKSPGVGLALWIYSHVMFLAFAFTAIVPVALYTPINLGGLGFGPSLISYYMAAEGASQALWLLLAFPFLQHRLGTKGVMEGCGMAYPFMFVGYIILNFLLRQDTHASVVSFWVIGAVVAIVGPGVSMSFTGAQLALNDASPSPHVLGTLNAIALTASSAIRSVVPGVSTVVYAIGVRNHILGGHLAWVILIPLAAAFWMCARWLPEDGKPRQPIEDEEDAS